MVKLASATPKKEETDLKELQSNEFAAGIIRGIKEFKEGKGKTYQDKDEFLTSLKNL